MSSRVEAATELEAVNAEKARRHFKEFVRQAWPIVEPDTPLSWNFHHDMMCEDLEALARGGVDRLLYNVPPGTSKTRFFCVLFPAWVWTWAPSKHFLVASYIVDKSEESVLAVRDLVRSGWYTSNFNVTLRDDQSAKRNFQNTRGGSILATSTDGRGTGEHPNFAIIDDPHSAKRARSEADRKAVATWLKETMSTRGLSKKMAIGLIMQRLHQEDLTGHVLKLGTWKHVCVPMRYEPEQGRPEGDLRPPADPRDPRRTKGELLWPALMTPEKVRAAELELGPYGTAGQFQQRPSPEGGGLFKREWLPVVDASQLIPVLLHNARRQRGWDTAASEESGDYTVGVRIADLGAEAPRPRFVVEDVRRGQWGPAKVDSEMRRTAAEDTWACAVCEEQEPGGSGKAVVTQRRLALVGYNYKPVPTTGDKVVRAGPFRAQCEAGNVALLRGSWNEAYLQELESFPMGSHDDQVDASSASFNELMAGGVAQVADVVGWGF